MDVKATRLAMGLTAAELAAKLSVAPSTIYRLESGSMRLTPAMRSHIASVAKRKVVEAPDTPE